MNTEMQSIFAPTDGDVVIRREEGYPVRFLAWQFPHGTPMTWRSREAALNMAEWFAAAHGVDVWLLDGGLTQPFSRHRRDS